MGKCKLEWLGQRRIQRYWVDNVVHLTWCTQKKNPSIKNAFLLNCRICILQSWAQVFPRVKYILMVHSSQHRPGSKYKLHHVVISSLTVKLQLRRRQERARKLNPQETNPKLMEMIKPGKKTMRDFGPQENFYLFLLITLQCNNISNQNAPGVTAPTFSNYQFLNFLFMGSFSDVTQRTVYQ